MTSSSSAVAAARLATPPPSSLSPAAPSPAFFSGGAPRSSLGPVGFVGVGFVGAGFVVGGRRRPPPPPRRRRPRPTTRRAPTTALCAPLLAPSSRPDDRASSPLSSPPSSLFARSVLDDDALLAPDDVGADWERALDGDGDGGGRSLRSDGDGGGAEARTEEAIDGFVDGPQRDGATDEGSDSDRGSNSPEPLVEVDVAGELRGAEEGRTRRTNPRMRTFAYLSQPIVEVRIIGLVFLSCFLQAIDTLEHLPPTVHSSIVAVDTFCVYVFAVEFFLRWWSAGRFQWRYLTKPLAAVDAIVVILPLFLSGLLPIWDFGVVAGLFPPVHLPGWLLSSSASSALLNLRLLRTLKFQRVLTDERTFVNFEMALGMKKERDVRPYQLQLARVLISIFTLVSVSTGLIYTAEHEVNPQIPDYFTALYFGLTTLTTVGFGDITPVTFQGRMVVGGTILAGAIVLPAQAASLAEAYLDYQKERGTGRREPFSKVNGGATAEGTGREKCQNCGAGPHRSEAAFCWSCGKALD
ncbi:hypothetical protein ACHAWF_009807 [Thalassiosira exigua]